MALDSIIQLAIEMGASDLHLEGGLPATFRVRGALKTSGAPVAAASLKTMARELLSDDDWRELIERRSFDLAKKIGGVRCRINILHSARGMGFAIRLLSNFRPTIRSLNLHPDIAKMVRSTHQGLIIVSGATGSGKTSTLAAMIQEVNAHESRHIITVESPIEYVIAPQKSFIRQREVGRDTPSFEQALFDAMREDPDVLMVGEMRDPQTMRLTLNAAETGHLVLATLHSSTVGEALARIVASFPSEIQGGIAAQLADCLVGVICQRLSFRQDLHINVPECEILTATTAAKGIIRQGQFTKLQTVLETGGQEGNFSFARYRDWLHRRDDYYVPSSMEVEPVADDIEQMVIEKPAPVIRTPQRSSNQTQKPKRDVEPKVQDGSIEIPEIPGDDEDPFSILSQLEKLKR